MDIKTITFEKPKASGTIEMSVRYVYIGDERVGSIRDRSVAFEFVPHVGFLGRISGSEEFVRDIITKESKEYFDRFFVGK